MKRTRKSVINTEKANLLNNKRYIDKGKNEVTKAKTILNDSNTKFVFF